MQRRLPLRIRDLCKPDAGDEPPLGLSVALRCDLPRGTAANFVEYWQFETAHSFNVAINGLIQRQQIPVGNCARDSTAVGPWDAGDVHAGRMLCYPVAEGSWIVWTYDEDRIVGRAFRNDDGGLALYTWAKELALFLGAR